jgi:hypothetical protein
MRSLCPYCTPLARNIGVAAPATCVAAAASRAIACDAPRFGVYSVSLEMSFRGSEHFGMEADTLFCGTDISSLSFTANGKRARTGLVGGSEDCVPSPERSRRNNRRQRNEPGVPIGEGHEKLFAFREPMRAGPA